MLKGKKERREGRRRKRLLRRSLKRQLMRVNELMRGDKQDVVSTWVGVEGCGKSDP